VRQQRVLVLGDAVVPLGGRETVADGAVVVVGDRVAEVGTRAELECRGPFDRIVGGSGYLVIPGFVNGHYHTECWTSKGLIGTIFEVSNLFVGVGPPVVKEEVLELLATWGLVNAAKGGQTTTLDVFYGKPAMDLFGAEPVLRAYERVGLRTALALSVRDQNRYAHEPDEVFLSRLPVELAAEVRASPLGYAWPVEEVLTAFAKLVARWDGRDDRVRLLLAPDWTPACSDELFRLCRRTADEFATGLTTHVLETRSELMWNVETHGKPAVRRLLDLGVLGHDVSFSHFVWATDEDIRIAGGEGVNVVSNPGSNLRLSSGICRVRDLVTAGVPVGFGTDGISFSDQEDFFQELRLAAYLQRQPDVFSEHRLASAALLTSAGNAGAGATGYNGRIGRLAAGTFADLVVVRTERILFPPGRYDRTPLLDVLLDRASAGDIDTVMVGGRTIVERGRVTTVDEDALRRRIVELNDQLYPVDARSSRWGEMAAELLPHAQSIYDRWYGLPVTSPGSVYNARRPPTPTGSGPTGSGTASVHPVTRGRSGPALHSVRDPS
jgi:5-methylthioadenosine/S-adenosylhomocysteine deaminase